MFTEAMDVSALLQRHTASRLDIFECANNIEEIY